MHLACHSLLLELLFVNPNFDEDKDGGGQRQKLNAYSYAEWHVNKYANICAQQANHSVGASAREAGGTAGGQQNGIIKVAALQVSREQAVARLACRLQVSYHRRHRQVKRVYLVGDWCPERLEKCLDVVEHHGRDGHHRDQHRRMS